MLNKSQLADRIKGIGGSDVSVILGLSSFKTPLELYLEKTGLKESEFVETPQQEWGNILEPVIAEQFSKRNGNVAIEYPDTIVHPFYDFMRANVDGYIRPWNSVLEIKTANAFMAREWGYTGTDIMPLSYLAQVAHYVSCLNAKQAHIALLLGGSDYREFIYTRDYELEQTIIDACKGFWHAVQNKIEPDAIIASDLKIKYPAHTPGKSIVTNDELAAIFPIISEARQVQRELKEMEEECKFKIMKHMQNAECLTDIDGNPLATWKVNVKGIRTLLLKGV